MASLAPRRSLVEWMGRAALLGVLVLVALGVMSRITDLIPSLGNPFASETVDRSGPALLTALEDISQYQAATGHFQEVIDLEDDTGLLPDFISGERVLFVASGTVDAEVDFSGLDEGSIVISEDGEMVTITLPPATLSEPRIDPSESYVVERERGLLDRVGSIFSDSPTDDTELYVLAEEKLAAAAAETDLIERAEENTRGMLQGMLGSLGYTDVNVIFAPTVGSADH